MNTSLKYSFHSSTKPLSLSVSVSLISLDLSLVSFTNMFYLYSMCLYTIWMNRWHNIIKMLWLDLEEVYPSLFPPLASPSEMLIKHIHVGSVLRCFLIHLHSSSTSEYIQVRSLTNVQRVIRVFGKRVTWSVTTVSTLVTLITLDNHLTLDNILLR